MANRPSPWDVKENVAAPIYRALPMLWLYVPTGRFMNSNATKQAFNQRQPAHGIITAFVVL